MATTALVLGLSGVSVGSTAGASTVIDGAGFAGYEATTPVEVSSSVHAVFTVPAITCGSESSAAGFVVQIIGSRGLPASTELDAECTDGTPTYVTSAVGSQPLSMTVHAGDRVALLVRTKPSLSSSIRIGSVTDLTTGVAQTATDAAPIGLSMSAFVGVESVKGPVADFGRIEWADADVDGSAMGTVGPQIWFMVGNPDRHKVLVWTSDFSPAGGSFKNVWRASS
jgi:hypothetical protein